MCLLNSCRHPSLSTPVRFSPLCGLWLEPTSARELIILIIDQFCFLTFTGGNPVTPRPILQTLDLECIHLHIILGRNMKKIWQEGGGVGSVVVSQYDQLKFQTQLSLTEIFQPWASKVKLDDKEKGDAEFIVPFPTLERGKDCVEERAWTTVWEGNPLPLTPVLE